MNKLIRYFALLIFISVIFTSCARPPEDEQLKESKDEVKIELEGMVFPKIKEDILAPVSGELGDILVKNGALVRKNDDLIKYNRYQLQLNIDKIKAQIKQKRLSAKGIKVAQNNTILNNNKEILKNITYLYNMGAASLSELLEAQNNYASSIEQYGNRHSQITIINSELKLLEFDLIEAQHIFTRANIKAKTEGFITELVAYKGKGVVENEKLGTIININKVIVKAGLASGLLPYVKVGQEVEIKFLTTPRLDLKARVSRVIPVVDPQFGRMVIEVELDNPNFILQPDTKALVSIVIPKEQQDVLKSFKVKNKKVSIRSNN